MRVLVTGGSGFLGQAVLVQLLAAQTQLEVHYTYRSQALPEEHWQQDQQVTAWPVDMAAPVAEGDADALTRCFEQVLPDIVVHTFALSSPAACERDPETAERVNVPRDAFRALVALKPAVRVLFTSTDQVYSGEKAVGDPPWLETDDAVPVNVYGRTKLAMEQFLQDLLSPAQLVMLRLSNMLGGPTPLAPLAGGGKKFLQFLDERLAQDAEPVDLFEDEMRSFVAVQDVTRLIVQGVVADAWATQEAADAAAAGSPWVEEFGCVFNVGGSEILTRVQLAEKVAVVRGHALTLDVAAGEPTGAAGRQAAHERQEAEGEEGEEEEEDGGEASCPPVKIVPSRRADLGLPVPSPSNIGMDISRVAAAFADSWHTRPMDEALSEIFASGVPSDEFWAST